MKRVIWFSLTLVALLTSLTIAFPNYLQNFHVRYETAGSALDNCGVCHGASTSEFNPYGQSFADSLVTHPDVDSALVYIEQIDSDGDGVINITEIMARSFPGDPDSTTPVESVTWGEIKRLFE